MGLETISSILSLGILPILISLVFGFIVGTLFLMLTAKIFRLSNVFLPSVKMVAISTVVSIIVNFLSFHWVLGLIFSIGAIVLSVYLIKRFFEVGIAKAIGMWVVWVVLGMIIIGIIIFLLWTVISSVLIGSL